MASLEGCEFSPHIPMQKIPSSLVSFRTSGVGTDAKRTGGYGVPCGAVPTHWEASPRQRSTSHCMARKPLDWYELVWSPDTAWYGGWSFVSVSGKPPSLFGNRSVKL